MWVGLILKLAVTAFNLYNLTTKCGLQFAKLQYDPWYEDFNLISEEFEPKVKASDYNLTETII